ncbi:unnamed protein product [Soboliphyme baturini]|uniref:Deoxyhypusine monooxygenase n=1 Tax=Soboliphyme baturini TaxID=241478 RepID=A0A183IPU3_9BILA|nr:unnamed protein product [Soboliphyme baturini]
MMLAVNEEAVRKIGDILSDKSAPLKKRFRALFTLRTIGGCLAIDLIAKNFTDSSALLKHELAYCLGQMRDTFALPTLRDVLSDETQETIVRHEAGEAIGAIGDSSQMEFLEKYRNSSIQTIAETCELACQRLQWWAAVDEEERQLAENVYDSVDPAPSEVSDCIKENVCSLERTLLDEKAQLWNRYRALFALRNIASDEAILSISKGMNLFWESLKLVKYNQWYASFLNDSR